MNGFTEWYCFVLDRQHGQIYWDHSDSNGLYVFDILKGQKPLIVPAFSPAFLSRNILHYVSGEIFIWLDPSEVILIDASKEVGNLSLLYQRADDEDYVVIALTFIVFNIFLFCTGGISCIAAWILNRRMN